ncbi:hypothetical protein [Streptomyces longwoodensis]|uniref:hypothetical protein n=1 Tax=Streptomyces longwoodensis TaxID=68231 RepID=UPI0033FC62EA
MTDQGPAIPTAVLADEVQMEALVGSAATVERFMFGGATVVMGPSGTVAITEVGDALDRSCVWNAEEVRLVGQAPAPVMDRLVGRRGRVGADETSLPIHLAVRVGKRLLYLGTGHVGHATTVLRPGCTDYVLTDCLLRLRTPLNRSVLDVVRPLHPAPGLPDLRWLRHVTDNRAVALEQFITGWYPDTGHAACSPGMPEPSRPLPEELEHLYRLARQRPAVLGSHNHIVPEHELRTDHLGELLVFGVENQGCFSWGLLWTCSEPEPDPTVWFREFDEAPIAENERLSGFLIQFSLFEAAMGADYTALADRLTTRQAEQLTARLHPVPLRPFWPWAPTRFYVGPGLVVYVSDEGTGDGIEVGAGAVHRSALQPLLSTDVEWSRFDG